VKVWTVVACIALAACTPEQKAIDAKLAAEKAAYRGQMFQSCLKALPAGPQSTQYNDWSEVVDSCGRQAFYMMNTKYP